jgi:hypothetical protein
VLTKILPLSIHGASWGRPLVYFIWTGFTGFYRIILFFIFITFRMKVMKNNPLGAERIYNFFVIFGQDLLDFTGCLFFCFVSFLKKLTKIQSAFG